MYDKHEEEDVMQNNSNIKKKSIFQKESPTKFHVGYYYIHEDVSLNFQMNRWISYLGDDSLEEMKAIAPKIKNYADWKREFLALAEKSLSSGKTLAAAYYIRSAEFFTFADSPDKKDLRERFLKLVAEEYADTGLKKHLIPYTNGLESGFLPAYRLTPEDPKDTIVLCGGFDAYVEELFPMMLSIAEHGYDIISFDGPGQGGALEEYGLSMTHEWEKPVKAVLDYFKTGQVTLIGMSLGGYLAVRAAAYEPRVLRVIAFDVMYDFMGSYLKNVDDFSRFILKTALATGLSAPVNALIAKKAKTSPIIEWGIRQGMHVTGTTTPFACLRTIEKYTTKNISSLVRQDVLLMAGNEDHYVPVDQLYSQTRALTNARSLTMRLFTRAEHGQNHCQVGNMGLAAETILAWTASMSGHST